jgi:hypothetical protein
MAQSNGSSRRAGGGISPTMRSRMDPPPIAVTPPSTSTPMRSNRFRTAASAPEAAKVIVPIHTMTVRAVSS